jgi:hypothetical protein
MCCYFVVKVVQNIYWGTEVPSLPSAHDSAVASNLLLFCRTILAAVDDDADDDDNHKKETEAEVSHSFSLSTFCSNIIELDKHRGLTEPAAKKQRFI